MIDPITLTVMVLVFLLTGGFAGYRLGRYLTKIELDRSVIDPQELTQSYVHKDSYQQLREQADMWREDLLEKNEEVRHLSARLSSKETDLAHLDQKLQQQDQEVKRLQEESRMVFENVANRLLEEKSEKFSNLNQEQLGQLLAPLGEKITAFEQSIRQRLMQESRDRLSLQKEIEQLRELNLQLSTDANNLVSALKGEQKTQGDWGEWQLERLLEKSGLQKGTHFRTQTSFRDENGRLKRPDFIIDLPENRNLVIDCKVSLVDYERYCASQDENSQKRFLKAHANSLRAHVVGLGTKNYQQLYQINSPDYLLLFVPIEPAYALAVQYDPQLFADALDRNIVIVTTSTLLATMRTVSYLWKQEKQQKSVLEIVQQSGRLYDKFVAFVEDLQLIGQRIDQSQNAYRAAMNKLSQSAKRGDTLIGRAERIKQLGARASKQLPKELLED